MTVRYMIAMVLVSAGIAACAKSASGRVAAEYERVSLDEAVVEIDVIEAAPPVDEIAPIAVAESTDDSEIVDLDLAGDAG